MSNRKTTTKQKNTFHQRFSFLKKHPLLYWVVGFFLLIFVIAPLAQTVLLRLQVWYGPHVGLRSHSSDISKGHNDRLNELKQTMQISTPPVYSAAYNSCYKGHSDGGWMVNNYYYTCELSYVEFFDVPPVASSYISSVVSSAETRAGTQDSGSVAEANDLDDYLNALDIEHSSSYKTYAISLLGNSDARRVTISTPSVPTIFDKREIVHESGSSKLDVTKRYLILTDSDQYYYQNLGCAIGRPLFCFSPI